MVGTDNVTLQLRPKTAFMTTLTITAKGQVPLKQDLLKHLGVGPGEKIEADKLSDGRIVVRAAAREGSIADFIGSLRERGGRKLRIDEINETARSGWAKAKYEDNPEYERTCHKVSRCKTDAG
jgi:antitoxin PrlF